MRTGSTSPISERVRVSPSGTKKKSCQRPSLPRADFVISPVLPPLKNNWFAAWLAVGEVVFDAGFAKFEWVGGEIC